MGKVTLYIYTLRIRTYFSFFFAMSRLGLYVVCLTLVGFIGQGTRCTLVWEVHECPYLDVVIQYYAVV